MHKIYAFIPAALAAIVLAWFLLFAGAMPAFAAPESLGIIDVSLTAAGEKSARSSESTLADFFADAVLSVVDADVVILNGGDFTGDLPRCSVTEERLRQVLAEDRVIALAEVTPKQLCAMLEAGVSHIVLAEDESIDHETSAQYGGFPQVAGLRYLYDASAPVGQRIMQLYLADGTELSLTDDETVLRLAATEYMFSGGYDYPVVSGYEKTAFTLVSAAAAYVSAQGTVSKPETDRIHVAGTTEASVLNYMSAGGVLVAVLLLGLFSDKKYKKVFNYYRQ